MGKIFFDSEKRGSVTGTLLLLFWGRGLGYSKTAYCFEYSFEYCYGTA